MNKSVYLFSLLLSGLAPTPATRLDPEHVPFVSDFRAADGDVRLVLLLSPT